MMIHEKLMTGQFLLDLKNDRAGLLHAAHHHHHHQPHHAAHLSHAVQPPSPPMPTAVKMELYSAYAYQQQLQQHLIGSGSLSPHQSAFSAPAEVLDLSRRCDSVETPRKTPSPYQTNSSFGTGSPAASPTSSQLSQQPQTAPLLPMNLLYSGTAQQPHLPEPQAALPLPAGLASLYPALYYPGSLKQEPRAAATVAPPQIAPATKQHSPLPVAANSNLLHSFSVAAAASASMQLGASEATSSPDACSRTALGHNKKSPIVAAAATTPTRSNNAASLAVIDAKATRPFKAFPRDPLVIAANFAATDVLLDNPRVERYTEYRKRVLEQIRHSNGGARCVTNPKMRRTNSRSGSLNEVGCSSSNNNSETEERNAADESSDCESNAGNFEKMTSSTTSTTSTTSTLSNGSCASSTTDGLASAAINGSTYTSGHMKDAAYYERRRKNNAAAKKSRDRRRIKEDEIAIRAAYLERQNIELLCQIDSLKSQLAAFTSKVGA